MLKNCLKSSDDLWPYFYLKPLNTAWCPLQTLRGQPVLLAFTKWILLSWKNIAYASVLFNHFHAKYVKINKGVKINHEGSVDLSL